MVQGLEEVEVSSIIKLEKRFWSIIFLFGLIGMNQY